MMMRLVCRLYSRGRPPAPLGGRILTNPDDVFQHNMWDHVQWTEEERASAQQKAEENSAEKIPPEEQITYHTDAHAYWERFYQRHRGNFFRHRNWLFTEFPELLPPDVAGSPEQGPGTFPGERAAFRILEVGCGPGNSVFPIIRTIRGRNAFVYCCDFSPTAVKLIQEHPEFERDSCHVFVRDVCDLTSPFPFPTQSLDVILLVFVLSAIHPSRAERVVQSLAGHLKPGGTLLFRDYGRHDLSQLRIKRGQCLSENFYMRQDGTCVYFFTKEEVSSLLCKAGLEEVQNLEDRRLQVNRRTKTLMRRVWMQSKFRRPLH